MYDERELIYIRKPTGALSGDIRGKKWVWENGKYDGEVVAAYKTNYNKPYSYMVKDYDDFRVAWSYTPEYYFLRQWCLKVLDFKDWINEADVGDCCKIVRIKYHSCVFPIKKYDFLRFKGYDDSGKRIIEDLSVIEFKNGKALILNEDACSDFEVVLSSPTKKEVMASRLMTLEAWVRDDRTKEGYCCRIEEGECKGHIIKLNGKKYNNSTQFSIGGYTNYLKNLTCDDLNFVVSSPRRNGDYGNKIFVYPYACEEDVNKEDKMFVDFGSGI